MKWSSLLPVSTSMNANVYLSLGLKPSADRFQSSNPQRPSHSGALGSSKITVWPGVLTAVPMFTLAPPGVSTLAMGVCPAAEGSPGPAQKEPSQASLLSLCLPSLSHGLISQRCVYHHNACISLPVQLCRQKHRSVCDSQAVPYVPTRSGPSKTSGTLFTPLLGLGKRLVGSSHANLIPKLG